VQLVAGALGTAQSAVDTGDDGDPRHLDPGNGGGHRHGIGRKIDPHPLQRDPVQNEGDMVQLDTAHQSTTLDPVTVGVTHLG